ncbi:MAG: MarR family transcriptional regulator [Clostridia bacterium]|nr:MarR family transcriptional regulator [Clostridia bacterium]
MATLSDRLVRAMRDLHRNWMDVTPKADINKSQHLTLRAIKVFEMENPDSKGATVKDLAKRGGRSPASISQKIAALEELGLVYRTPDEHDKRVVYFHLTEEGEKVHDDIHRQMSGFINRVVEKMGETEVIETAERIEKLLNCIKETNMEMMEGTDETD